jgi:hypothetical protein
MSKTILEMEIELNKWMDELGLSAMETLPLKAQFATGFYLARNIMERKNG